MSISLEGSAHMPLLRSLDFLMQAISINMPLLTELLHQCQGVNIRAARLAPSSHHAKSRSS
jgi:hypothetical protein